MTPDTPDLAPEEVAALRAEHDLAFFEPPSEAAPAEAEREANRLLAALKSVRQEMAANQVLRDAEVSRQDQWLNRVNRSPKRQEAWLLSMLENIAPFLRMFGKKKSRDLPHGVVGWRKSKKRVVIVDPVATVAWAKARGLPVETKESVAHATVEAAWKEAGASSAFPPPGCKVVESEDAFYAEVKDVG